MTEQRKEVELLVRARLKGAGDIDSITKSIGGLETAIEKQAEAAARGESSIDALKAATAALKVEQDKLGARSGAIQAFERLSAAVEKTQARVQKAGQAYDAYQAKLAKQTEVTDAQQNQLVKLSAAFERAQKSLAKQQSDLESQRSVLAAVGIQSDALADAQLRIRDAVLAAGVAQDKGNKAIAEYADTVSRAREQTRLLAQQQALLNRLQEGNDNDARLGRQQRELELARQQTQEQARQAAQQALLNRLQEGNNDDARLARQQAAAAAAQRQAETLQRTQRDTGLKQQADDAEATARAYSTLARASTNLRPRLRSVRDAVDEIINPGQQARQSLGGVEAQVRTLAASVAAINGPVGDYRAQLAALEAAQRGVATQAGLIDRFRTQAQLLRENRAELSAARAQVLQYAAAVRQGGDAGAAFVRPLAEAEARVKTASAALQRQIDVTRQSRAALQAAGIETRKLADAETRLAAAAKSGADSTRALTDAVQRYGQASRAASGAGGGGLNLFGRDEGRTTLSLLQRIRGEVLALGAAYIGLQGTIGLAGGAIDQFNTREGIRSQLFLSVGNDRAAIDEEYAYIKAQADRIGVEFDTAAKGYAKFAASAAQAGRSRQEIRFIFEAFTEVGKVANLTSDDLNGVFRALEQVVSKGKIQAEELRGQLGERLFGAFAIAAKALKDQFPDLDKALENGQVSAQQLVLIAEEYRRTVGDRLPDSLTNLSAEQARFNTQVNEFKLAIADAGFADAYLNLLRELTAFFKSDDGRQFAVLISDVFSAVAQGIAFAVRNAEELTLVLKVIAGILAINLVASNVANLIALGTAARGAAIGLTLLQKAVVVLGLAFAAWQIGTYAYENFETVRLAAAFLVTQLARYWSAIKFGAQILWEEVPVFAENAFKALINGATFAMRKLLSIFAAGARALGMNDLAANLASAVDSLFLSYNQGAASRVAALRKEAFADQERIKKIGREMMQDALRRPPIRVNPEQPAGRTDRPAAPPAAPPKVDEAAIKKRQNEIEAIENALNALEARTDKKSKDILADQLSAIDLQNEALKKRITELGGAEGAAALARFNRLAEEQRLSVRQQFNERLATEQEALNKRLEDVDAAAGRRDKANLDARLAAIEQANAQTYRNIADFRAKLEANNLPTEPADAAKARLDSALVELKALERQKFLKEELQRREAEINDLLKARELSIAAIENQVVAGNLTRGQADAEIRNQIAAIQPAIDAAAASAREFALANETAFNPAAVQEFINKLQEALNSGIAMNAEFDRTGTIIKDGLDRGITDTFNSLIESLVQVQQGTADWGDAFDNAGKAILRTLLEILRQIAITILREQALIAIQAIRIALGGGTGPGAGGNGSIPFIAGVKHSGGVVGGVENRTRAASPAWFANAPRYHRGGVVGMAPDEYPAILQKNEEVLAAGDPRNVLNGGANPGSKEAASSTRFVLVDDRSRVAEAMAGAEGENVIMVQLRKNIPTLRNWITKG